MVLINVTFTSVPVTSSMVEGVIAKSRTQTRSQCCSFQTQLAAFHPNVLSTELFTHQLSLCSQTTHP